MCKEGGRAPSHPHPKTPTAGAAAAGIPPTPHGNRQGTTAARATKPATQARASRTAARPPEPKSREARREREGRPSPTRRTAPPPRRENPTQVLRRCPGGLPSLESQRSGSLSQQEKMKEASPVQPSDVDSANSEPHIPPPRPLFAPTTLIVGDSIIRHVRFFFVFCLIVHVGCNDISRRESEETKADFMDLFNFLKQCGKSVFISGPLPGLSPSTERFSRLLGMNTWLQTACMTRKGSFIDNFNLFWNRTSFYCLDRTHPNRMGSSILSANIRYAVQTLPRD
uniref:SGNH hydrolase-type esterase domain-containing protein n=1 Tax=Oryzias latipes TaxID=8090 RepID=A0A3P9JNH7_ORYLA